MWLHGVTFTLLVIFTGAFDGHPRVHGAGIEAFLSRVASLHSFSPVIIIELDTSLPRTITLVGFTKYSNHGPQKALK